MSKNSDVLVECFTKIDTDIVLLEGTDKKDVYLKGIYAQTLLNGNSRVYPFAVLDSARQRYIDDYISKNRAIGELNHPSTPYIDPKEACIKIEELYWKDEQDLHGKGKLTTTPNGALVRGLVINDGIELGISSRGTGQAIESNGKMIVQNGYKFRAFDVVTDPSAKEAYLEAIYENKAWIYEDGILKEEDLSNKKTELDKTGNIESVERMFDSIYNEIKKDIFSA